MASIEELQDIDGNEATIMTRDLVASVLSRLFFSDVMGFVVFPMFEDLEF